jgi:serine/threonine-protein kinase
MYDEIASGGMATVHFGRLLGEAGFLRTVAIKHLLPHYSHDAEFISMFLDEARLAARIQHPNATVPLDVVVLEESEEIFLIMEYIHGDTLARLLKGAQNTKNPAPPSVIASIMSGALHGLHAAHEATNELGVPLNIVHRDVSPQNIMVGVDGVARVLDFGVAKAISRLQSTRQGQMKGKLAYMAPEQVRSGDVDRRVDVFAAGIVLWEALTLKNLFKADDPAGIVAKVLAGPIGHPSVINPDVPPALDRVVMAALERDVSIRFQTAGDFASAIEEAIPLSARRKVGEWVTQVGSKGLALRADKLSRIEGASFDADSSNDPLHVFRSKRVLDASAVQASRSAGDSDSHAEQSASQKSAIPASATGRGEVLPTPPVEHLPAVLPAGHPRKWLVVATASLVVAIVGAVWVSPRVRTKTGAASAAKQDLQVAATASAVTESRPLPRTDPVAPGAVAPNPPPVMAPETEETARTPAMPTVPETDTRAKARPTATRLHPSRKPTSARTQRLVNSQKQKDCNPPYYMDPNGIRRVKDECL